MRTKKALFFDQDIGICRTYAGLLRSVGYQVVVPSLDQSLGDQVENCDIVFFGAAYDEQQCEALKTILQDHPGVPLVCVLANDVAIEKEVPSAIHRKVLGQLGPGKEFLNVVEEIVDVGQRLGWGARIPDMAEEINPSQIDTIDLGETLDLLLDHFGKNLACTNITWIEGEYFQEILPKIKKGSHQELGFQRTATVRGWLEKDMDQMLGELRTLLVPHLFQKPLGFLYSEVRPGVLNLLLPVPSDQEGNILGYFFFEEVQADYDSVDFLKTMLTKSLAIVSRHLRFCVEHWQGQSRAYIDDVTGLYNQRYMMTVLDSEISRADRGKASFSVLFIDVDHFKRVNDTRGHWVGSKLLFEMGQLIKDHIRLTDLAFRYGGDEFVVVLSNTDAQAAQVAAERIRASIEKRSFKVEGDVLRLTVSIGLASYPLHAQSSAQLLQIADQAMYYGKNLSRNVVYIAS